MFTQETKSAICAVAQDVVPDMQPEDARDPAIVAEIVLDAGRLEMFGYPDAQKEFRELCKTHGWDAVCKAAEQFVPTY